MGWTWVLKPLRPQTRQISWKAWWSLTLIPGESVSNVRGWGNTVTVELCDCTEVMVRAGPAGNQGKDQAQGQLGPRGTREGGVSSSSSTLLLWNPDWYLLLVFSPRISHKHLKFSLSETLTLDIHPWIYPLTTNPSFLTFYSSENSSTCSSQKPGHHPQPHMLPSASPVDSTSKFYFKVIHVSSPPPDG